MTPGLSGQQRVPSESQLPCDSSPRPFFAATANYGQHNSEVQGTRGALGSGSCRLGSLEETGAPRRDLGVPGADWTTRAALPGASPPGFLVPLSGRLDFQPRVPVPFRGLPSWQASAGSNSHFLKLHPSLYLARQRRGPGGNGQASKPELRPCPLGRDAWETDPGKVRGSLLLS